MIRRAEWRYKRGENAGQDANAKYLAAEAGFKACECVVLTHGGFGYPEENHVKRLFRESMLPRIVPISRELSLSFIAERALCRPAEVCVMRAVARQREVLPSSQASWEQRMQKALAQMNIQLTEVTSDVMGQTGQAIIRDIVAGECDGKALARHGHRRVKAREHDILRALTGNGREEHLFALKQALAVYDVLAKRLQECGAKLGELLAILRHAGGIAT